MELLFLFHGEDDLERFRAELDAATYRLPWLSPGPSPAPVHVQADGVDSNVLAVQDLKGMALRMSD